MKAVKPRIESVYGEGTRISFLLADKENEAQARRLMNLYKDKTIEIDLSEWKEKRSQEANAYCWVLCQKLADELGKTDPKMTKDEVYRSAISNVGIYKDFSGLNEADAKTIRHAWEMLGTGWMTEQVDYATDGDHVTIRCYYGSSVYNTKQMARLINYLVADCKELGIETLSPDEIRRLYAQIDKGLLDS